MIDDGAAANIEFWERAATESGSELSAELEVESVYRLIASIEAEQAAFESRERARWQSAEGQALFASLLRDCEVVDDGGDVVDDLESDCW